MIFYVHLRLIDLIFSYSSVEIDIPVFDFPYTVFQNLFDDWFSNIQLLLKRNVADFVKGQTGKQGSKENFQIEKGQLQSIV